MVSLNGKTYKTQEEALEDPEYCKEYARRLAEDGYWNFTCRGIDPKKEFPEMYKEYLEKQKKQKVSNEGRPLLNPDQKEWLPVFILIGLFCLIFKGGFLISISLLIAFISMGLRG